MPDEAAPGPLAGVRVLDLGLLVQGPQAALLLSDLGAIAILEYAQEHSDQYGDETALDQTVRTLRPQINSL